ncbi:MAG: hypothetical protein V7720_13220 [Halioglobus sp.]
MFFAAIQNREIATISGKIRPLRLSICLFGMLSLLFLSWPTSGANDKFEVTQRAEKLTQSLFGLNQAYQASSANSRNVALQELLGAAIERRNLLLSQIENNPELVLGAAVPASVRARMPVEVQAHIESKVSLPGTLEVLYEDYEGGQGRLKHFLRENDLGPVSLHFEVAPTGLLSGLPVTVTGVLVPDREQKGGAMALHSDGSVLTLAAKGGKGGGNNGGTPTPTSSALGERRTLVILVNFQDFPSEPYTREFAEDLILGTTSDYFLESSGQQTWLSGDVVGWHTIPVSSAVCDRSAIALEAEKAAAATGVDIDAYSHRIYAFPQIPCGWWGLSSVGGNPTTTWITGKLKLGVTAHELGHSFGLYHSQSLDCGDTTLGSSCTQYQYGDTLDMMGSSSFAHFNPFQKELLGWLNTPSSPSIETIESTGTYSLESYAGGPGSGPKALKILKSVDPSTGVRSWYYVHARQAVGFDSGFAANTNVLNGVSVLQGTESQRSSSLLLDMTPGSGDSIYLEWIDPALEVGQSFEDPVAGVIITTEWVTDAQAAVNVEFGTAPVNEYLLDLASDQVLYTRGQTAYLTTTVTSGGWPIAGIPVSFSITKANGSEVRSSGVTNGSGMLTYTLRIKRRDPVGIYQAASVVNGGDISGSVTTNFQVE